MKKTSQITFVTEYYYPVSNAPATRFKPLVDALKRHFAVHLMTSAKSRSCGESTATFNRIPFPENTHSTFVRLALEVMYALETFVRLLFTRSQLYYITSPSYFNCMAAFFFCRLMGKAYIVDIRDDYPRVFFDNGLIREHSRVGRFLVSLERKLYKHAFMVIAATEGLRKNIKALHDRDVYLLRNGFSEKLFGYTDEKYSPFTLVFHGNLSVYQGIDTIIKLADELERTTEDVQIVVVGKGSEAEKLSQKKSNVLRYLGPKQHHEISPIIQKAHVGLSFRKSGKISEDAFPVRAYEYIGSCLPVLVTPVSEAGYYVQSNQIGFQFREDGIKEIVDAILKLKNDHGLYQKMIRNLEARRLDFSRERLSSDFADYLASRITLQRTS